MIKYIAKAPVNQQHTLFTPNPKKYWKAAQNLLPCQENNRKETKQILGSLLSYERTIKSSMLHALSSIALQQNEPSKQLWQWMQKLFNYAAMHLFAKFIAMHQIWYYIPTVMSHTSQSSVHTPFLLVIFMLKGPTNKILTSTLTVPFMSHAVF